MALKFSQQIRREDTRLSRTERIRQKKQKTPEEESYQQAIQEEQNTPQEESYQQAIQEEQNKYSQTLNYWRDKLERAKARLKEYQEYLQTRSEAYKKRQSANIKKNLYEKRIRIKDFERKIKELEKQAPLISQGYSAEGLSKYAQAIVEYKREKVQQAKEQKAKFVEAVKSGKLTNVIEAIGLKRVYEHGNLTYKKYKEKVKEYTARLPYLQSLQEYAKKVGFKNLSIEQQRALNPQAVAWQEQNPTETLNILPSGEVVGVTSGVYGRTFNLEDYNKRIDEQQKRIAEIGLERYALEELQKKQKEEGRYTQTIDAVQIPTPLGYGEKKETIQRSAVTGEVITQPVFVSESQALGMQDIKFTGFLSQVSKIPLAKPIIATRDYLKSFRPVFYATEERKEWGLKPILQRRTGEDVGIEQAITEDYLKKLERLSEKIDERYIGVEKIETYKQKKKEEFEARYQTAFENAYGGKIATGELTYEEAVKRFEDSEKAKVMQKQFEAEYKKGYTELGSEVGFFGRIGAGFSDIGVNIAKMGVGALSSPYEASKTSLSAYWGIKLYKSIPSIAKQGLLTYYTGKGFITSLDKEKSYRERGVGAITGTVSLGLLTYSGYRALNKPVIKRKAIRPRVKDMQVSEVVGEDKYFKRGEQVVNRVVFPEQKLSQVTRAGSRAVVTSRWRDISNKFINEWNKMRGRYNFLGLDINFDKLKISRFRPIYRGIPSLQPATYKRVVTTSGSFFVKTAPSGYEKAFKYLRSYGYTSSQAMKVLRYQAPIIAERWIKGGYLNVKGDKAIGTFVYETRYPRVVIDKQLGIVTRGKTPIVERKIVFRQVREFQQLGELEPVKKVYERAVTSSRKFGELTFSTSVGSAGEVQEGFGVVRGKMGNVIYPTRYKRLVSAISEGSKGRITPIRSEIDKLFVDINQPSLRTSRTILLQQEIDLDKIFQKQYGQRITGGKKTPLSATFKEIGLSQEQLRDLLRDKFVPTPAVSQELQASLKSAPIVDKAVVTPLTSTKVTAPLILSRVQEALYGLGKISGKEETALKITPSLKPIEAIKQTPTTKIKELLKTALKQDIPQKTRLISPLINEIPIQVQPIITKPVDINKTIRINPAVIYADWDSDKLFKKLKEKRKRRKVTQLGLLPDFTARVLGLESPKVDILDIEKELRRVKTGLEIRTGGRLA